MAITRRLDSEADSSRPPARTPDRLPAAAWLIAAAVVLVLVPVADRYGFHGDEFYFVVTGAHLQAAAPDNPMLVPFLAAGWYWWSVVICGLSGSCPRSPPVAMRCWVA